jgi:hypothetical protein
MRKHNVFWAFVLVTVGAVLLLNNFGILNVSWHIIWPSIIILFGLWILLGTIFRRAPTAEEIHIPLQNAERAEVTIAHGAGRLSVSGKASPNMALDGSLSGGFDHSHHMKANILDIEIKSVPFDWIDPSVWGRHGLDWDLHLNSSLPTSLEINGGASDNLVDLSDTRVTDLKISTGASSTKVTLPTNAGFTKVKVDSGAASLDVKIPESVAARINIDSGLTGISVDTSRFPKSGGVYISPNYDSAENKVDIKIDTGVGSVSVR